MTRVCLPKDKRDELKAAFKSGDISLAKLYEMTSDERNKLFSKYVGDSASLVNARMEQAMLSSQKKALSNAIKGMVELKDPIRRDMLQKVKRIEKFLTPDEELGFLDDLAEVKLGLRVTEEEAQMILDLKNNVDSLLTKVDHNSPIGSKSRMDYGLALEKFREVVGDMKIKAESMSAADRIKIKNIGKDIVDIGNATKASVASADISFGGRQGIPVLFTKPSIWLRGTGQSMKLFAKELFAKSPEGWFKSRESALMAAERARVNSSPNALNGKYRAAKNGYGLGVAHEEAIPTSLPERVPLLGRVFKASETSFSAAALRMRRELADYYIDLAEKQGLDTLDEKVASGIGNLVTSMTGRGELQALAPIGNQLNATFFSPRFFRANWNVLTAHSTDKLATDFTRKQARKNLLKIVGGIGSTLVLADTLNPGSVDWDPRSTNFGRIKSGETFIDVTGGLSGLVKFFAKLATGERYSANTRKIISLREGGFGQETTLDLVENFIEGKMSPIAGAVRDILQNRNFDGEKPNVVNTTLGLITPISVEMVIDELKRGNSDLFTLMLAEELGFSSTPDRYRAYGKKWDALREADNDAYNKAIKQVTTNFNKRADKLENSAQWERMTQEERNDALDKIRNEETDRALSRYGI